MPNLIAPEAGNELPIDVVEKAGLDAWLATLPAPQAAWARGVGFDGALGRLVLLPGPDGAPARAALGWGDGPTRGRGRFHFAHAAGVPAGAWRIGAVPEGFDREEAALAWLLAGYRFDRYRAASAAEEPVRSLAPGAGVDLDRLAAIAAGEVLTRDLINTPAADMGPAELADAAAELARAHGATFRQVVGEALPDANFPLIHAVGRAAARQPRLIELRWGREDAPRVTLVGKGVCFDTGGLNLKPGASMALMKKDMGGAATVLGLARMLMGTGADLSLRVLIPAAENAVSGDSFRPGDVLRARNGLTVEVNNTDAEGRLVLADALALADEETPDLLVCMATLTGAARVAVGPDLAPFYTDDDALAAALADAARKVADPVWRMPFHAPYEEMIEPAIADLDNAPKGGMAGSITAALFLRRFVAQARRFVHFDIYGWQPKAAPARPVGGVGQGARALLAALPAVLDR